MFHKFFTAQYNLTSNNKWISFGGSYSGECVWMGRGGGVEGEDLIPHYLSAVLPFPGALSAWLRLKHPEVVVGAVATSGPVQAVVDFSQYLEVVNDSLATSAAGRCLSRHVCNGLCVVNDSDSICLVGVWCDKYVSVATDMLDDMIRNQEWGKLEKLFQWVYVFP